MKSQPTAQRPWWHWPSPKYLVMLLFGPWIMLWYYVTALRVSATLSAAFDAHKKSPRPEELQRAALTCERLRSFAPTLRAIPEIRRAYIASGVLWGGILYAALIHHAFEHLENTVATRAAPPELFVFDQRTDAPSPAAIADTIIRAAAIENPDVAVRNGLKDAVSGLSNAESSAANHWGVQSIPLALAYATSGQQCSERSEECKRLLHRAMTRLLTGASPGLTEWDLNTIQQMLGSTKNGGEQAFAPPSMATRIVDAALFRLSKPLSPAKLAELLLRAPEDAAPDAPRRKILQHILETAIDAEDSRAVITYEVGFLYGPGRLAVFVLLFCVLNALMYRQCARILLEQQAGFVRNRLVEFYIKSKAEKRPSKLVRWEGVKELCQKFDKEFPNLYVPDENDTSVSKSQSATTADPRMHPIAGLLSATHHAHTLDTPGVVQIAEELAKNDVEHWRETLNTYITLFPVVGFSATLLGLISAFASADKVAIFYGSEKATAIREMIMELSSCFATTFLALLFMALLTIVSLRQSQREVSLITLLSTELRTLLSADGDSPPPGL